MKKLATLALAAGLTISAVSAEQADDYEYVEVDEAAYDEATAPTGAAPAPAMAGNSYATPAATPEEMNTDEFVIPASASEQHHNYPCNRNGCCSGSNDFTGTSHGFG